ncbi:MAG TPA: TIGR03435 family protein [Vicinamibacterales bacterium]|nr:TIGR03435 family protein [Vicinamibacterales bacterium]
MAAVAALLLAQSPSASRFDVASVKPNTRGGGTTRRIEPQSLTYLNVRLGEFIEMAYDVHRYQVAGEDWITSPAADRYDIVAKAAAPASEGELRHMLVQLLADRFHLQLHRETRVSPVYALVVAKGGHKLKEGDGGQQWVSPDPRGGFRYQNYPLDALALMLSLLRTTGRPVIDRTGLTGRYSFTANLQDLPAGATETDLKRAVVESETTVFAALEQQLGLKLIAERAPVDMLIVDHADRIPTED